MMAGILGDSPISLGTVKRNDDGHREYSLRWIVEALKTEGPYAILNASGLPEIGSTWNFGGADHWAFCTPNCIVSPRQVNEGPVNLWNVDQTFITNVKSWRCQDSEVSDPLMEPIKISGTFVTNRREAMTDKDGKFLVTSAQEKLTGPGVEFDFDNPTVHIELNIGVLPLTMFSGMVNTVNDASLWGLPKRFIKLANTTWERKVMGRCQYYYTVAYDFQIDYSTRDTAGNPIGFDHEVFDYGNRCLKGYWSHSNPTGFVITSLTTSTDPEGIMDVEQSDFDIYRSPMGEVSPVALDGHGRPALADIWQRGITGFDHIGVAGPPASAILKYYQESNFLLLGIPTIL